MSPSCPPRAASAGSRSSRSASGGNTVRRRASGRTMSGCSVSETTSPSTIARSSQPIGHSCFCALSSNGDRVSVPSRRDARLRAISIRPSCDGRALQVRVGGDPRLARRLLLEQPAGRELPAHQPRARGLVAVLADQQRARRGVDRGVGEAQVLALRPVPAGLGEGSRPTKRRRSNSRSPLLVSATYSQSSRQARPPAWVLTGLPSGSTQRDVAVAAGAGVGDREPRGARRAWSTR